jgi:thioesterase domain-containing protein
MSNEALARTWAEVLGVDRVGPLDDFFDLGGDSILLLHMLARARDVGVDLDLGRLGEFLEEATCARLLELTGQAGAPATGDVAQADAPDITAIALRAGGASTNVFVLLPTLHDLWAVRELGAQVDATLHVLVPAWSPRRPYASVPSLGASVATTIRTIQTRGPYRIVGSCAAGQTAIEAASRLAGEDLAVALLVLLDTGAPRAGAAARPLHRMLPVERSRWAELGSLVIKLAWLDRVRPSLTPDQLMLHLWTAVSGHIGDLMKFLVEVEPAQWTDAYLDRAARTFMTWLNYQLASEAYATPPTYAGPVHLVHSREPDEGCADPVETAAAWSRLTGCEAHLDLCDGVHSSAIVASPTLARLIDRSLAAFAAH